ncbi:MAG: hypothetical protein F4Y24_00375 [Gemmatimonadetes bacterium]|nr:hypothetical protein [Gemmatimonadota bacterium]MYG21823.1 hypothetical protein [Gemmatimonadota bacterium]MYJ37289.1 hypothetical protein [Gemmatimonadota bacterium]
MTSLEHRHERLPVTRPPHTALALILTLSVACSGGGDVPTTDQGISTWTTEAAYQLAEAADAGVFFETPVVRADPERDRVVVVDAGSAQVSVWTPEGVLRAVEGRVGEGLGAFPTVAGLFIEEDGTLSAVDGGGSRFAYFAANGEHLGTQLGPGTSLEYEGLSVRLAPPRDGVYLGTAEVTPHLEVGATYGPFAGQPPMLREPVLRVRRSDTGQWLEPEPLLWLDISNRVMAAEYPDGGRSFGGQPFGDYDQVRFEPGTAIVMRTKGGPGSVELIEVDGAGDTVWHRHLQLEPRQLTREMVDEVLDARIDVFAPLRIGRITREQLRDIYDEALYQPEYLPAAQGRPIPTSSGEIWFRTHEVVDTLRVHYAVRRGDMDEPPRRVLLPEWLRVHDATATHVWGIRRDPMDMQHVVGRRLVELEEE